STKVRRVSARSAIAPYRLRIFAPRINNESSGLSMKRFLLICSLSTFALGSQAASPASGEYIMLIGGPSMYQWEKYKAYPHDHWWANFVRAARLRTEQLRNELGRAGRTRCLIYGQGMEDAGNQNNQDLIVFIARVAKKLITNLIG